MPKEDQGRFDDIYRRAFENYLLELVRNSAAEEERMYKKIRDKELNPQVLEVDLKGEYPDTLIRIYRHDRVRDKKHWFVYPFWKSDFFDENGKRLTNPERMAGDILMWARGG